MNPTSYRRHSTALPNRNISIFCFCRVRRSPSTLVSAPIISAFRCETYLRTAQRWAALSHRRIHDSSYYKFAMYLCVCIMLNRVQVFARAQDGSPFASSVRHFLRPPMRNESHLCSLGIFINFIYITCAERASRLRHGLRKHNFSLCCCASVAAVVAAPAQRQSHSYFCSFPPI